MAKQRNKEPMANAFTPEIVVYKPHVSVQKIFFGYFSLGYNSTTVAVVLVSTQV